VAALNGRTGVLLWKILQEEPRSDQRNMDKLLKALEGIRIQAGKARFIERLGLC